MSESTVGKLAFFCHHQIPFEVLTEEKSVREEYIRAHKPANEVATRLRWFKIVPNEYISPKTRKAQAEWLTAQAELRKAWAECLTARDKAWAERDKAQAERDKARVEWDKALAEWDKAWAECPLLQKYLSEQIALGCPWDAEQQTLVFPNE